MESVAAAARLAKVAFELSDASGLERTCRALETGYLSFRSTAAARAEIAAGNTEIEQCLLSLRDVWQGVGEALSPEMLSLLLRTSHESVAQYRTSVPVTQVVWTGPKIHGSFVRSTREVIRDIIRRARFEILIVGYWIATDGANEGVVAELITSLGQAVQAGVAVTALIDERERTGGGSNLQTFEAAWPKPIPLPRLLTWRLPQGDQHLKLHAKVLVADRHDALVTSANLTMHGMDRNMEMGVRVIGKPAVDIAHHFELLEIHNVVQPYVPAPAE